MKEDRGCGGTFCVALVLASGVSAQATTELWAGSILLPANKRLDFTFRITRRRDGVDARIDIPLRGVQAVDLQEVEAAGNRYRFTLGPPKPKRGRAHFDLRVVEGDQATAVGVMLQHGTEFWVAMRRIGADQKDRVGFRGPRLSSTIGRKPNGSTRRCNASFRHPCRSHSASCSRRSSETGSDPFPQIS